jgi:hypothetical protein
MQVEKHQGCSNPLSGAATSCGATVAQAHSALFPARLALARWMYGGDVPHVHSCTHHIARAAWYDQAQDKFQAWIDAGGFHSPELGHTDSAIQDAALPRRRRGDGHCSDGHRSDGRRGDAHRGLQGNK